MATDAAFPVPKEFEQYFCQLGPHEGYPWRDMPWKGIANKVLFFDPVTGATIELARVKKGSTFPQHYHTTLQTLFLVSGQLRTGAGTLIRPGTFNVIPAGQIHGPFIADEDSIQFKYFNGTPVYLLTDGNCYIYKRNGETIDIGQVPFMKGQSKANILTA